MLGLQSNLIGSIIGSTVVPRPSKWKSRNLDKEEDGGVNGNETEEVEKEP